MISTKSKRIYLGICRSMGEKFFMLQGQRWLRWNGFIYEFSKWAQWYAGEKLVSHLLSVKMKKLQLCLVGDQDNGVGRPWTRLLHGNTKTVLTEQLSIPWTLEERCRGARRWAGGAQMWFFGSATHKRRETAAVTVLTESEEPGAPSMENEPPESPALKTRRIWGWVSRTVGNRLCS